MDYVTTAASVKVTFHKEFLFREHFKIRVFHLDEAFNGPTGFQQKKNYIVFVMDNNK